MSCLVCPFSVGTSELYVNNLLVSSCRRLAAALGYQSLGALGGTSYVTGRGSVSRGGPALCNWSKMAVGTVPRSDVQQATSGLRGVSEQSVGFVLGHTGLVLFYRY